MNRTEKKQEIDRLRDELASVRNAVLLHYRGITVPQVTELRAQIRKGGGRYAVVKNTLLTRAVAGSPLDKLKASLKGPTAIAWSDKEPIALAKTLQAFLKTAPMLQVRAVLLDGEPLPAEKLDQVASLPSREELRAKLAVLLASPMRRLATALAGPARNFAAVVKQKADKTQ